MRYHASVPPTRKHLPDLPGTGRHYYREDTMRARLRSPGIERYARRRSGGGRVALALVAMAALVAAMLWLS
jgi:hypothetical protein